MKILCILTLTEKDTIFKGEMNFKNYWNYDIGEINMK